MAHYAFVDQNNIVVEVITGIDETELIEGKNPEEWYGNFRGLKCLRTSYNENIRFNFAGIGFKYDPEKDGFIAPNPECGHDELYLNNFLKWICTNSEHLPPKNEKIEL